MKLTVLRHTFTDKSTIGDLLINGLKFCFTLEPVMRETTDKPATEWKIDGKTAIPIGVYKVIIDFSNRFQKELPHVLNVPFFEGIRIHNGSFPEDTKGCLLVGYKKLKEDMIVESRIALKDLLVKINESLVNKEEVTIEYLNG